MHYISGPQILEEILYVLLLVVFKLAFSLAHFWICYHQPMSLHSVRARLKIEHLHFYCGPVRPVVVCFLVTQQMQRTKGSESLI